MQIQDIWKCTKRAEKENRASKLGYSRIQVVVEGQHCLRSLTTLHSVSLLLQALTHNLHVNIHTYLHVHTYSILYMYMYILTYHIHCVVFHILEVWSSEQVATWLSLGLQHKLQISALRKMDSATHIHIHRNMYMYMYLYIPQNIVINMKLYITYAYLSVSESLQTETDCLLSCPNLMSSLFFWGGWAVNDVVHSRTAHESLTLFTLKSVRIPFDDPTASSCKDVRIVRVQPLSQSAIPLHSVQFKTELYKVSQNYPFHKSSLNEKY